MPAVDKVDRSECPLVESRATGLSGESALLGTRMPPDAIIENFDYGITAAEIAEQFALPVDQVQAVLAYAQGHRVAHLL